MFMLARNNFPVLWDSFCSTRLQVDAKADERYDNETTTLGKNVTVAKYIVWLE